jgi:hypothetical protein
MHIVFETERVVCVASFIQYIYVIRIILHDQKKGFRTPSNSNEIYTYTVKKKQIFAILQTEKRTSCYVYPGPITLFST